MSIASCGTYELLDSGDGVTADDLAHGDRVRVRLVDGDRLEDVVVRLSDDAVICKWHEFQRQEIAAIELWHSTFWRGVGVIGGVVGVLVGLFALAAYMDIEGI